MALVPVNSVDYLSEARQRITSQFEDKVVVDKYLQLLIDGQAEIQQMFADLIQKRSIDEAEGATLDIIGEIVGQPRELISADLFNFFGFQGALKADTFGDLENSVVGSKFYNLNDPLGGNVLFDDETYRLFIKTKILKNRTASTPEEFLSFVNFLFGTDTTAILSEGQAEYTILFGRVLSPFEQTLLNYVSTAQGYPSRLIPKTVGVRVNYGYFESGNYFGFQGAPGAKGFGDDPRTFDGGYGSVYGQAYGESIKIQESIYDGSSIHDGSITYSGEKEIMPVLGVGGFFATLF